MRLIIDSAESLGASYSPSRKACSGGDASILSFNGNKIITTSGGGMLVTRHEKWAEQARFLATQARDPAPHHEHSTFGYNYRLSNICAAIGLAQLKVLDQRVARRRQVFEKYSTYLNVPGVNFMPERADGFSTRWLTAITVNAKITGKSSEDIRLMLLKSQIESRPLWKPMHIQPLYKDCVYHGNGFDESLFSSGLCLPSGSDMAEGHQNEIIDRILSFLDY